MCTTPPLSISSLSFFLFPSFLFPPSALSQVKSFLPSLARANKELEDTMKEEGGKDRVNIESEHEGATQCIQLVRNSSYVGSLTSFDL